MFNMDFERHTTETSKGQLHQHIIIKFIFKAVFRIKLKVQICL